MDLEMKRTIILSHYQNPINRGLLNNPNYISVNTNSESCIDSITLEVLIENDIIKDIRFDGEACAICTSSTSIMIETLLNKNVSEAKKIVENFGYMINERDYDSNLLEEANVYDDISKQPNRKRCALLSWGGMEKCLNKYKED